MSRRKPWRGGIGSSATPAPGYPPREPGESVLELPTGALLPIASEEREAPAARHGVACPAGGQLADEDLIPRRKVADFAGSLAAVAGAAQQLTGEELWVPVRRIVAELERLAAPSSAHWISVEEAARQLGCSAETVRRWCRTGRAEFGWRLVETGRYEIWAPDLRSAGAHDASRSRECPTLPPTN